MNMEQNSRLIALAALVYLFFNISVIAKECECHKVVISGGLL